MQSFLKSISTDPVTTLQDAWVVQVPKPDFIVKVTIPFDVLEWFVAVTQDGRQVWSDWMDYYSTANETKADMRKEMESDVRVFIDWLMTRRMRLDSAMLEWQTNGRWTPVQLFGEE
jgi:hypothetical protein